MSSFRKYGGLNYSANNSITRSYISNSEKLNVNTYSGQKNSKEVFASHIDMSGNSILHTGCIYFQDGSFMCTASNNGDQEYTQWMNGQYNSSIYYNFGNVGIGTTTPSSELEVNGNITTETITQTSDYRIKENIKPLNLEQYNIDNLNPVYFRFKESGKESIGIVAHELKEYYPFLVEGEKDGNKTQSVNYNGLIGVLIKEIQELKKRIKILENKIE